MNKLDRPLPAAPPPQYLPPLAASNPQVSFKENKSQAMEAESDADSHVQPGDSDIA